MKTYAEVADYFDVDLCPDHRYGVSEREPINSHAHGYVTGRTVHWTDRKMNRLGLRRFLMLVATIRIKDYARLTKPMRIYAANVWASRAARELHIRFPGRYSDGDRRRVMFLAQQGQPITIAARRWAANTEEH